MEYEEFVIWSEPKLPTTVPQLRLIQGAFYKWIWGQRSSGEWDCCAMISRQHGRGFELISARTMPIATLAMMPAIPPRPEIRRVNPFCG